MKIRLSGDFAFLPLEARPRSPRTDIARCRASPRELTHSPRGWDLTAVILLQRALPCAPQGGDSSGRSLSECTGDMGSVICA